MSEVLLLAAGASTRMRGPDKLLEDIQGVPLLHHAAKAALGAKVERVNVVLPPDHQPRLAALHALNVNRVTCQDWQDGMSASLRAGLAAISLDCDAVIIALADMPADNGRSSGPAGGGVRPAQRRARFAALSAPTAPRAIRYCSAGGSLKHWQHSAATGAPAMSCKRHQISWLTCRPRDRARQLTWIRRKTGPNGGRHETHHIFPRRTRLGNSVAVRFKSHHDERKFPPR